tara:strand:- start:338 stop:1360 length:1023 start_codon:yes stop_codon:yes gene_type:complete
MQKEIEIFNTDTKHISRSVLVVGGSGYIGTHLCKQLEKNGYVPVVVDRNLDTKPTAFGPSFDIDLPTNIQALDDVIKRYNIDSCIHLAGSSSVGASNKNPALFYKNNVALTMALLDKLIANDVNTFVFSSTASVYADNDLNKCMETSSALPSNAYGSSKLAVESILKDYSKAYDINCVALRYFNVAGYDIEADPKNIRYKPNKLIDIIIDTAHRHATFKIFGNTYPTKDGTCVRDYVHVMDVAEANLKALNYCRENKGYQMFNIGSGIPTSNLEIINEVQRHLGKINTEIADARNELYYSLADITKAKEILDWTPAKSSIDKIVASAVKWYNMTHKKEIQ